MQLHGIHHVTAITANITANHAFYTDVLGLRLVKKTVNQDDVSAYHLFYGDGAGHAGSDITFFDWPSPAARHGRDSISQTSFRVPEQSLAWWSERFDARAIKHRPVTKRAGQSVLEFSDPDGQRLSLVADIAPDNAGHVWQQSSVPPQHQILGLGPVTLTVSDLAPIDHLLRTVLNMHLAATVPPADDQAAQTHVYQMGDTNNPSAPGAPAKQVHVRVAPDMSQAEQGAGAIHHVAFRTTGEDYNAWATRLRDKRVPASGPVDRFYFRSLYFRVAGILFELATDGPGFDIDEPLAALGNRLSLPPFLEPQRADIESNLQPLNA